jgi:hypothetical protein
MDHIDILVQMGVSQAVEDLPDGHDADTKRNASMCCDAGHLVMYSIILRTKVNFDRAQTSMFRFRHCEVLLILHFGHTCDLTVCHRLLWFGHCGIWDKRWLELCQYSY